MVSNAKSTIKLNASQFPLHPVEMKLLNNEIHKLVSFLFPWFVYMCKTNSKVVQKSIAFHLKCIL